MMLQITYNDNLIEKALEVARLTAPYADVLEIGPVLLYAHGKQVISLFKKEFSEKKIAVASRLIAKVPEIVEVLLEEGADTISLLAATAHPLIQTATSLAHAKKAEIALDLMDAHSLGQTALDAKILEVDSLIFYPSYTEEGISMLEDWESIKCNTTLPIYIAGRVTRLSAPHYAALKPAGLIIGKEITQAENPAQEAAFFKSCIEAI